MQEILERKGQTSEAMLYPSGNLFGNFVVFKESSDQI